MRADIRLRDALVVDVDQPAVDEAVHCGGGKQGFSGRRPGRLVEAYANRDADEETEALADAGVVFVGLEFTAGDHRVLGVLFDCNQELLHVVQLRGAMAFHGHLELKVQQRPLPPGTAHPVHGDGMDRDRSVGGLTCGWFGTVIEADAHGRDGVGKYPEELGQG